MSENLVEKVQEMLKEETWTRATISNYTQNDLQELTVIVKQAKEENCSDEIQSVCEEHLTHTKDSIIALYLAGIFSLQKGGIDNSNLENLVDIFQKNHKETVVKFLCDTILADNPNNRFALRTLASSYLAENNEKYWELYEKIVRVDPQEADLAKALAEHYDSLGDSETALEYYKKSILRYINLMNYNATKDIWSKLVNEIPQEIDFFQLLRSKVSKVFGEYKTATLMQELYSWYKDNQKWDIAIDILKQNLEVDPKDIWARKEITDCYKNKYANHSHLDEYIKSSNLTASYRNVFEAINDFEKHISFDKGTFVYHPSWYVGRIRKLEKDTLTINFGSKFGIKEMSLKMAVTSLQPLAKDHIWVLKATKKPEELKAYVKDNKEETLKLIIRSFNNRCEYKRIKAELVPSVLTQGEWTSWNTAAKKILETNPIFAKDSDDNNFWTVREKEITPEEKLSTEFKAQKLFFARIDIFMKYLNSDLTDKSSELFAEMYSYFTGYLKNITRVDEHIIAAYLVSKSAAAMDEQFAFPVKETFAELYSRLYEPNPVEVYTLLKDTKNTSLRKDYINFIKMLPDWNEEYIKLFPTVLSGSLISDLIDGGFTADVQKLVRTAFDSYKDYRESVIFFFKNYQNEEWYQNAGVDYEKQLITLIKIIDLCYREIVNHKNSTDDKKFRKNAFDLLFKDDALFNYMFADDSTLERVNKFYTMLADLDVLEKEELDYDYMKITTNRILEKYPDFKFRAVQTETTAAKEEFMFVTAKMHAAKKDEIDNLEKVEIPKNKEDEAEARAKGDLRENAEYTAAKEKGKLLQKDLSRLKKEMAQAKIFDPANVTTAAVSFGTVITIVDEDTKQEEVLTILGQWESDPDNNIISYISPLGKALMNMQKGETKTFTVNDKKYVYTIKDIKKADF